MESSILPENVDSLLSTSMAEVVKLLKCDRCFLYVRHPQTRLGKAAFCFCRNNKIPDVTGNQWQRESFSLEKQDPMFAAALQCQPHIFIEDVETAAPEIVNRDFEKKHFGHRALIHAHLCREGQLWGVLQPCVFFKPRIWTKPDRQIIKAIAEKTTPLVVKYVEQNLNLESI
jgi:GAF domain-containing protein